MTGQKKRDVYTTHYPGGYEIESVDTPKDHVAFNEAYRKHVESFHESPRP